VIIGAMLLSPLMNPILGLGFSLAVFQFSETRRSLSALVMGSICAVAFTALIVVASPLKDLTSQIVSRTRPNLFDLLIALFAALAGAYAIIRGGGGTIVGVAIATAIMPPLAVVGFGLATWNIPVLLGALALFATNFVTIALAATIVARFFGFGHDLSSPQSWLQTVLLVLVFVGLSIPLGLSLNRIARETVIQSEVRAFLADQFGAAARLSQVAVDFQSDPLSVHAVVIAPRSDTKSSLALRSGLEKRLGRTLALQVDQLLVSSRMGDISARQAEVRRASEDETPLVGVDAATVRRSVSIAAGVAPEAVLVDPGQKRAEATAAPLPGADLASYQALEQRAAAPGWRVAIIPPYGPMPIIRFADGSDSVDSASKRAILASAWAAKRWNMSSLGVPGLTDTDPAKRPRLDGRRARAIAAILEKNGVRSTPLPPAGPAFRLVPARSSLPAP
jgi:uncharacterized hydrophobic protein (TIGR00271 family)